MIELKQHRGMSMQTSIDSYVRLFWNKHQLFWNKHQPCQVIVMLETSYDGKLWSNFNAIAFPLIKANGDVRVGWLNDILDGEDYVRILGIQDIQSIDVYGGLPEEA